MQNLPGLMSHIRKKGCCQQSAVSTPQFIGILFWTDGKKVELKTALVRHNAWFGNKPHIYIKNRPGFHLVDG